MPMLSTTFSSRGTCIALVRPNCSVNWPRMSRSYTVRRRGIYVSAIDLSSRALGDAHLGAILLNLETDAGRLADLADERDSREGRRYCLCGSWRPLQHLRRERDDLLVVLGALFARHGPEDSGADRLV